MKRRKLFTLGIACAAIMFTTSCSDDDADAVGPRLDVTENMSGSTGSEITVTPGSTLQFIWDARKGDTDLQTFTVSTSGTNTVSPIPTSELGATFPYTIPNARKALYIDTLEFNAGSNLGVTTYTFTIRDELGNSASRSFDVTVAAASTLLSAPQNFTWQRVGGQNGTGLSQFGLQWTNNSATNAIIAVNGATMVPLQASAWTNITTQEELDNAINTGTPVTQYTGVSSQQSGTYNDVLGVSYQDNNYLIHVTNGTVTTGGSGTTIVITGQYKD